MKIINCLVFLWKSSDNSITMKEPKEFKRRSLGLIKDDANQVSDLRLLSLNCTYLFSEDIKDSVSKYLGIELHSTLIPTFTNKKCYDVDPIIFKWCMELANLNFTDNNNKWMELQMTTVKMLNETITSNDKTNVQIANMLHTS